MRIRVLAFASASDVLGTRELEIDLTAGSRVVDLKAELHRRFPDLRALWPRLALAVDGQLVSEEASLSEGAEVALLPPVSGGSPERLRVALVEEAIDLGRLFAAVSHPSCGAVLLFVGRVRSQHRGRPVTALTYHAYRPMAETGLQRIVEELEHDSPGLRLAIVHRLGDLSVGEASVVIAAASPHRPAAYRASRRALERLKTEVPIWKREHYADGESAWREEEPLGQASDDRQASPNSAHR